MLSFKTSTEMKLRKYKIVTPLIAFIHTVTTPVFADDASPDTAFALELKRAFESGQKVSLNAERPTLQIQQYGHSYVLSAAAPNKRRTASLLCALCTSAEALSAARSLGALWPSRGDEKERSAPSLSIRDADDQYLWLDGVPAAPPDTPHPVAQGRIKIVAQSEGTVTRGDLKVSPEKDKIEVSTQQLTAEKPDRRIPVAIILAGLGLSAAASGGLFFAMNGDCTDDICRYQYNLKLPGIISMALSAVLQALSATLFATADFSRE
jgi:hypothetical protein